MKPIKILMIDDDESFKDLVSEHILKDNPGMEFVIDWYPDLFYNIQFNHDLYIVDNRINGEPKAIEIIKTIRSNDCLASIFVISGHADLSLMKRLINMDIEGFVDKDLFDISDLIKHMCKPRLRDKIVYLTEKTNELKCRIANEI